MANPGRCLPYVCPPGLRFRLAPPPGCACALHQLSRRPPSGVWYLCRKEAKLRLTGLPVPLQGPPPRAGPTAVDREFSTILPGLETTDTLCRRLSGEGGGEAPRLLRSSAAAGFRSFHSRNMAMPGDIQGQGETRIAPDRIHSGMYRRGSHGAHHGRTQNRPQLRPFGTHNNTRVRVVK